MRPAFLFFSHHLSKYSNKVTWPNTSSHNPSNICHPKTQIPYYLIDTISSSTPVIKVCNCNICGYFCKPAWGLWIKVEIFFSCLTRRLLFTKKKNKTHPWTMVIKSVHAIIAKAAMWSPRRSKYFTRETIFQFHCLPFD